MLEVSRQRVHELAGRPDFPEPLARLAAGAVWDRAQVAQWEKTWDRKPGRKSQARERLEAIGRHQVARRRWPRGPG